MSLGERKGAREREGVVGGREREREREREINVKEHQFINWLPSHTCPDQGSNPKFGYVPWPGIELAPFQSMG